MTMKSILLSTNHRFWSKVDITEDSTDCWEWTASLSSKGYGSFRYNGKSHLTHRFSYLLLKGDIPEGYVVSHRCDNTSCVNPNHLVATTTKYNNIDCIKKGRSVNANGLKTHCKHGHEFTEENISYVNGERRCKTCIRERDRKRHTDQRREKLREYQQAWRDRQKQAKKNP